ncbi:hypothetical protein V8F06_011588 [Rhypophila decipiens]
MSRLSLARRTLEPHDYERYSAVEKNRTVNVLRHVLLGYDAAIPIPQEQTPEPSAGKKICLRCGVMQSDLESPPPRPLTESCAHPQGLCNPCISFRIQQLVSHLGFPWNQVPCPECPQLLDFQTVLHFVPQYLKERLEKQSLMSALSADANFVWCSAAGCSSGQVHEGGQAQPIVTCISCGHKTCFTHKDEWHAGVTCAEIDRAAGGVHPRFFDIMKTLAAERTARGHLPPKDGEHEFPVEIEDEEEDDSEDEEEDDSEEDDSEDDDSEDDDSEDDDSEDDDSEDDEEEDSEDEEEDIAPRRSSAPGNKTTNTATPASVPMPPCRMCAYPLERSCADGGNSSKTCPRRHQEPHRFITFHRRRPAAPITEGEQTGRTRPFTRQDAL